jgi:hypothetical protein
MNTIKQSVRPLIRSIKKTDLVWRYGSNLRPTLAYTARKDRELSDTQREVVTGLNKDGIYVTTLDALFGGAPIIGQLEAAASDLLKSMAEDIEALKLHANEADMIGSKTFNLECLGSSVDLDPDSMFAKVAMDENLLKIADAYLGMDARLRYYNFWYTAASDGRARESQLWHFDREDNYILKVFIYLADVDEGAGPFTYAPGTHRKGEYRGVTPEYILEGGVKRTTDEQMAAVYPREKWKLGTGGKGTVIFADTRGYHKGGEARTRDRLMYTCMYTSPASESKNLLNFPDNLSNAGLSASQLRALGLHK